MNTGTSTPALRQEVFLSDKVLAGPYRFVHQQDTRVQKTICIMTETRKDGSQFWKLQTRVYFEGEQQGEPVWRAYTDLEIAMVRIQQECAMQQVSGFESAGEHGVSMATKGKAPQHPLFYGGINFTKEHVLRLAITPGTSSVELTQKEPPVEPKKATKKKPPVAIKKVKHSMKLRSGGGMSLAEQLAAQQAKMAAKKAGGGAPRAQQAAKPMSLAEQLAAQSEKMRAKKQAPPAQQATKPMTLAEQLAAQSEKMAAKKQAPPKQAAKPMTLAEQLQAQSEKMAAKKAAAPPTQQPAKPMTLAEQLQAQSEKMAAKKAAPRQTNAAPMTLAQQLAAQSSKLKTVTRGITPIDEDGQSAMSSQTNKVDKNMVLANLAQQIAAAQKKKQESDEDDSDASSIYSDSDSN